MQPESLRTTFVGLGVMGYPMAGFLAKAGHATTVYNRTASKAEKWVAEHGGSSANTPRKAATGADMVFCCVGNDDDVRDVILGEDGVLNGVDAGTIIVDHTTASATIAREIHAAAADKGVGFLDAPVSGGQAGAENGQLTVMAGGDADVFDRAAPVIDCYAKAITRIGPVGSGVQGLSEGLHFAQCAGLDPAVVIESISKGAAQSWQMENRWQTMVNNEFEFGFAVDWMRKDLGIALDEAQQNGAQLEMTKLVDRFYAEVQEMGGNRWDTSSLIARLKKV
jgi:3-hydroxyisobutyrate dehydrogenase-like beta-hydroxyacid dehydrogenase